MPANNIIFMDGFDHYNTITNLGDKWVVSGTSIVSGRHGGNAVRINGTTDNITKQFSNSQYICASFGFQQINGYPDAPRAFIIFYDTITNQIDLRVNPEGTISMTRNGTSLTGGTSTFMIPINCWHWIEIKLMISNSITASSCQVKINGELIIDLAAGQDTQNTANSYVNTILLRSTNNIGNNRNNAYDDFVLQTGVGSDFLGDIRIVTVLPNGNGNSSDFIGSDSNSTDNYLLVDDANADDDATYVQSTTAGSKDLYSFPALESTVNYIAAIGVDINCRKADSGFRQLCSVARINSTEQDGPTINMYDTYTYQIQDILPTNPETSLPWNQSEAEALQLGQKIIS